MDLSGLDLSLVQSRMQLGDEGSDVLHLGRIHAVWINLLPRVAVPHQHFTHAVGVVGRFQSDGTLEIMHTYCRSGSRISERGDMVSLNFSKVSGFFSGGPRATAEKAERETESANASQNSNTAIKQTKAMEANYRETLLNNAK